jgi:hypothetical protein
MRLTRIGALIALEPARARSEILAALEAAKGNRSEAAAALGAPIRTFHNWIDKLGLWPDIDALCRDHGFDVHAGPPRREERRPAKKPSSRKK